jgi:hypothetical protein
MFYHRYQTLMQKMYREMECINTVMMGRTIFTGIGGLSFDNVDFFLALVTVLLPTLVANVALVLLAIMRKDALRLQ